jgi:hypothetical protein
MFLFETFAPGVVIGVRSLTLEPALVDNWVSLFPEDRDDDRMPAGMTAVIMSRAYSDMLRPRPAGNVHGAQRFSIKRLPRIGDTLVTTIACDSKELKGERRWVRFACETHHADGTPMFTGLMTTLWAA